MNKLKKMLLYGITIAVIIFAVIWTRYMNVWMETQPNQGADVIRTDLFVLYPLVITLVALSLYRLFRNKKE